MIGGNMDESDYYAAMMNCISKHTDYCNPGDIRVVDWTTGCIIGDVACKEKQGRMFPV